MSRKELFLGQLSLFERSHQERCEAAAAAGFTGVSLFWMDVLKHRADGGRDNALRAQAERHGLRIVQLEFASLTPRNVRTDFRALCTDMATCAKTLGCDSVHAVALDKSVDGDDMIAGMQDLADACAQHDLQCGLEFVPFVTACTDLPTALRVIRAADRANAGIVLDALHFFRGGAQWDALAQLQSHEVVTLQINDSTRARLIADYNDEAMSGRLLPGQGELDLLRLLTMLRERGIDLPFTVEAPHRELNALAPADAAQRMANAAHALGAHAEEFWRKS